MKLGWKSPLKLENYDVLGLDIGSSEVRLVQLRKAAKVYKVAAAAVAPVGAGDNSTDHTQADRTEAIRQCVRSSGVQTHLAVCGLSGTEAAVRHFSFPPMAPEEIEGAVLLEAGQVCPFNVADSTTDYQLIPNGDNGVRGVLVAATKKLIRNRTELVEKASLKCVLMDIEGLALLNCFNALNHRQNKDGQPCKTTAILNVGSSHATLAIMGSDGLPFVRDISYGGSDIIEKIKTESNIAADVVGETPADDNNPAKSKPQPDDSLLRACRDLLSNVNETFRFYAARDKSAPIEEVYVCGDFAPSKKFVELLDSQLSARASLWNPFEHLRWDRASQEEDILSRKGPALAVAAGLALRSI